MTQITEEELITIDYSVVDLLPKLLKAYREKGSRNSYLYNRLEELKDNLAEKDREIERLDNLHKLDHSLADQWQKKNEELRKIITKIYVETGSETAWEVLK